MAAKVRPGDRKKTGFKDGAYPVATVQECLSAIKLRHNSNGHSASQVLAHVAASPAAKDPRVQAALKKARAADSKKK